MKKRKVSNTPEFINVTISSWWYYLSGEDREEVPEETYYSVGPEEEPFIISCCEAFKKKYGKEIEYEFRGEKCWFWFKTEEFHSNHLFRLTDIGLNEAQKTTLSKRLEILIEKYVRLYRQADTEDERAWLDGVASGLNVAHKLINGVADDYLFKIESIKEENL